MPMEADWEVEIGAQTPVIEALWPGFVDLRKSPGRVHEIEEARRFPPLAHALIRLNGSDAKATIWTAKCDLWKLQACDPYEMNAAVEESAQGLACYFDLLPRRGLVFAELPEAETWAQAIVARLRPIEIRCSRVDFVIRPAFALDVEGFGITAYLSACGKDTATAAGALEAALIVFADALRH
jgi:hypothetical protein